MRRNLPRSQHIIPAFYLAGFTDTGGEDGVLSVFDYHRTKHYRSSPRHASRQKDLYRILEPGEDPYVVERDMAALESTIAPTFREVVARGKIGALAELRRILSLAALIAARDRRRRLSFGTHLANSLREHLREGKIPREKWDAIRRAELRAGVRASALPEYDDARKQVERGEWAPRAPEIVLIGMIADLQNALLDRLCDRPWELIASDPERHGEYVTSDSPLVWGSLNRIREGELKESLQTPGVEVTFPISKSLALVSHPRARNRNCTGTREIVAHINMRTVQLTMGHVYYSRPGFWLRRATGEVAPGMDYFKYVKRSRSDGMIKP